MCRLIIFRSLTISLLVLFMANCNGGGGVTDAGAGSKCQPKWYKKASSSNEVVYGWSRESSKGSGLATSLGLAAAQADAIQQINIEIKRSL